LEQLELERSGH